MMSALKILTLKVLALPKIKVSTFNQKNAHKDMRNNDLSTSC